MSIFNGKLAILALAGVVAAGPALAQPTASQLNRLYSFCQTGDYASCTAYNQAIYGAYQTRQQAQTIEPASVRVEDGSGAAARVPAPKQPVETPAVAQTVQ